VAAVLIVVGGSMVFDSGETGTVAAGAGVGFTPGSGSSPTTETPGSSSPAASTPGAPAAGPAPTGPASSAAPTPSAGAGADGPVLLRAASVDDPYLVVVGGDSLAGAPAWSLEELTAEDPYVELVTDFRISTGVVRSDFFDWLGHLQTMRDRHDPDVVVLAMGANDLQSFPGGPSNPLSDEWLSHYGERVGAMLDELEGRLVIWIGLPPMGASWLIDGMAPINEAVRANVEARPWARYVDLFPAFGDEDGRFLTHAAGADGEVVRLRRDDGVHYTGSGGDLVASLVLAAIADAAPAPVPVAQPT
jgi:uncharacterized protein